ncbi:MAG: nucleotidyltransferase domain-containing protein [Nanoarchaeota archaeon]|nr:nucleotidyltransferase domain-containing protein [Nanoarchaeota archaeon]MBU1103160.1 nucleotidyltransferase domain-containing protein [Nanoarchaeota archaeon]
MKSGKDNKMKLVLCILKSPEKELNSRDLAKLIGVTPMGSLKIAKKLEKENILQSRQIGKAKIYSINHSEYAKAYISFLLKKEVEQAKPYVKRWIEELKKIKHAKAVILFGSVLTKEKEANDIDALILIDQKNFKTAQKELEEINLLNEKKIHPVYQTDEDLEKHVKTGDKIIPNAIKGIVVSGEDALTEILSK